MKIIAIQAETFSILVQRVQELEDQYGLLCDQLVRDRLYTSAEVGRVLGIGTSTLQNLRNTGRLRFIKLGNSIRYRWPDIENMLTQNLNANGNSQRKLTPDHQPAPNLGPD